MPAARRLRHTELSVTPPGSNIGIATGIQGSARLRDIALMLSGQGARTSCACLEVVEVRTQEAGMAVLSSGKLHDHGVDGEAIAGLGLHGLHDSLALGAQDVLHLHGL